MACVFSVDGVLSEGNCSYYDVLKHLKLMENKNLLTLVRPVKNHTEPTKVHLDMLLYAILDVVSFKDATVLDGSGFRSCRF